VIVLCLLYPYAVDHSCDSSAFGAGFYTPGQKKALLYADHVPRKPLAM